eukprot:COSAG03_NODE_425_length_8018_cov_3.175906_2_plen_154_part_00
MYTTYVDVPRQPNKEGRLLVKRKGEQWKPRWVVLKGPSLSAYKILEGPGHGLGEQRGPLKLSIDLGKEDAAMCPPPEKYGGLPVFGMKPGKGITRCFLQAESPDALQRWCEALEGCMRCDELAGIQSSSRSSLASDREHSATLVLPHRAACVG